MGDCCHLDRTNEFLRAFETNFPSVEKPGLVIAGKSTKKNMEPW
jgi:hypothetical protein